MAEQPKPLKPIEFYFEGDPNGCDIIAANGAWVGITTRGDIQVDFFVERQSIPHVVRHEITEDGLGGEIGREPESKTIRKLQVGVLLSEDAADSLASLIKDQVSKLKEFKKTRAK